MLPTWIIFVPIVLIYGSAIISFVMKKILGLRNPTPEEVNYLKRLEVEIANNPEEEKEKTD